MAAKRYIVVEHRPPFSVVYTDRNKPPLLSDQWFALQAKKHNYFAPVLDDEKEKG